VALDQEIRVELRGLEPLTPTLPVRVLSWEQPESGATAMHRWR
jgi:hypothetical protein